MKYIIKESQYNLLLEYEASMWVKRRATEESLKPFIAMAEIEFPTLCDDFGDEFEYANNIIRYAAENFMDSVSGDDFVSKNYDEVYDEITNSCQELFGEYLFDIYISTCGSEDYE